MTEVASSPPKSISASSEVITGPQDSAYCRGSDATTMARGCACGGSAAVIVASSLLPVAGSASSGRGAGTDSTAAARGWLVTSSLLLVAGAASSGRGAGTDSTAAACGWLIVGRGGRHATNATKSPSLKPTIALLNWFAVLRNTFPIISVPFPPSGSSASSPRGVCGLNSSTFMMEASW